MTADREHDREDDRAYDRAHGDACRYDDGEPDALMAALLGEPLSGARRADPAQRAAHRAATADLALLREQLGLIADALTEPSVPESAPAPVSAPAPSRDLFVPLPARRSRSRFRTFALGVAGVAAAGSLFVGGAWLVAHSGGGAGSGVESSADQKADSDAGAGATADSAFADPGYLACARLVAEGDVTHVDPVPGRDRWSVTLRVTRTYKPSTDGRAEVAFVMESGTDPLLTAGDHVLVGLPSGAGPADALAVGRADVDRARAELARTLPQARDVPCG
ncbi:hypothetical protein ACIPPJ_06415 [Streptomyces sp. NPDC086091]|uniref:hypothetical protein n=1 Tax=Streptomyces sp. NPDC086091 TaxID=3365751 RepID=UPI0037FB49B1